MTDTSGDDKAPGDLGKSLDERSQNPESQSDLGPIGPGPSLPGVYNPDEPLPPGPVGPALRWDSDVY